MRSIWFFLTKQFDLVMGAILIKYFSPVKEVQYLKGKK